MRDALRGLLGCAHAGALDLTPAERARCDERMGVARRTAPPIDPIPAEKRAYYDAVAAAYARTTDPMGPPAGWTNNGDRKTLMSRHGEVVAPLLGCGMKLGAPRGWKSYHDLPPHAVRLAKLGPLSCFSSPPSGRGFEESAVADPASLRERTDDAAHQRALDAPKPDPIGPPAAPKP